MAANNNFFIENVFYLLKRKEMMIGDLERAINISPGYLSRLKKTNSLPNGETMISLSKYFGVSLDYLVFCDIAKTSNDDMLIIDFLKTMIDDTKEKKIKWEELFTTKPLNKNDGERLSAIYKESKDNEGRLVHVTYSSMFVNKRLDLKTNIWVFRNNKAHLYLIPLNEKKRFDIELYLYVDNDGLYKICRGTSDDLQSFYILLSTLLDVVLISSKNVTLRNLIKGLYHTKDD